MVSTQSKEQTSSRFTNADFDRLSAGESHARFENNRAQESGKEDNKKVAGFNLDTSELEQIAEKQLDQKSASPPKVKNKDLHSDQIEQAPKAKKNFYEAYIENPNSRNIAISTINATLHGLATVTAFSENSEQLKSLNKIFDTSAFFFTKWLGPIVTYGSAAFNAFQKKDLIEMFIKLLPPAFLPFMGKANVDCVYGLSSSLNQPYDMASNRVRDNAHRSPEHTEFAQGKGDFMTNIKLVGNSFTSLYRDFAAGKLNFWKEATHLIGCPLIMLSSLPMMLFARSDRNSNFARVLGLGRNIGGIIGDIGFMAGDNIYKKAIGVLFLTGALSSIAKRWVDDKTAKIFIHLSSALDLSAYSIWNAFSETIEKMGDKTRLK